MILFEKGLEIKDELAQLIGDKAYIEHELLNYLASRTKSGLLMAREDSAKAEVKDLVKPGDIIPVGYPIWVQPLGAHDAYSLGARVSHNGVDYESTVANNVWEPGVYGWNLIV